MPKPNEIAGQGPKLPARRPPQGPDVRGNRQGPPGGKTALTTQTKGSTTEKITQTAGKGPGYVERPHVATRATIRRGEGEREPAEPRVGS